MGIVTAPSTNAVPRFRFPGGIWHHVALGDDAAIDEVVRAIVDRIASVGDRYARERGLMRAELGRQAREAASHGVTALYLAEQVTSGLPVTATLSVHAPTIRLSPSLGTDPGAVMDVFLEGRGLAASEEARAARFTTAEGEAFREIVPSAEGTPPSVTARFWVTVPGTKTLVPLQFGSPFVDLAAPLVTLFTAIVASVTWEDASLTP